MLNAKNFEIDYAYTIFTSCIATYRPPMTLRNYQPVAWGLYQRVIDQSKADIFIKPGINNFVSVV
jgi:hypothetical protein